MQSTLYPSQMINSFNNGANWFISMIAMFYVARFVHDFHLSSSVGLPHQYILKYSMPSTTLWLRTFSTGYLCSALSFEGLVKSFSHGPK
jgi:hypothetical protein